MAVYFFYQEGGDEHQIKIGKAKNVNQRMRALQTGNPYELKLVGTIRTPNDYALEAQLHRQLASKRGKGEWFNLEPANIWPILKAHYSEAFVGTKGNAFEIVSYDRDAVPEYMGVWEWGDLEMHDCCPFCGWLGGMHFQDASQGYYCIECDTLEFFHTNDRDEDDF